MSQSPHDASNILDRLIFKAPRNTLLVPVCAKELFVLRTLGTRWQDLTKALTVAYTDLKECPTGFGQIDVKLYVTRKYTQDNVVGTKVHELDLPQELFVWPLSK